MAISARDRVKKTEAKIKKSGLRKAWVYIPDDPVARKSLKRSAKRLRAKAGLLLPREKQALGIN